MKLQVGFVSITALHAHTTTTTAPATKPTHVHEWVEPVAGAKADCAAALAKGGAQVTAVRHGLVCALCWLLISVQPRVVLVISHRPPRWLGFAPCATTTLRWCPSRPAPAAAAASLATAAAAVTLVIALGEPVPLNHCEWHACVELGDR